MMDRVQGIVYKVPYKVSCHDYALTYVWKSKRSWSSRGAEHDPGCTNNSNSLTKQHAESTDQDIHSRDAQILELVLTTTTRGFSSSHGTQLLSTRGKLLPPLTYS